MRGCHAIALAMTLGVAVGCSSSTDVVAVGSVEGAQEPAGFAAAEDPRQGCEPGDYQGTLHGSYGSPELGVDVDGIIRFTLEETLEGEFLILAPDSQLVGRTGSGVNFSADIVSDATRGCHEGFFQSTLTNGRIAGGQLVFEGTAMGTYDPETRSFIGTWETEDPNPESDVGGFGTWSALHID